MVTMLDCIRRVPLLVEKIWQQKEENFAEVFKVYDPGQIDEIVLIGSGSSLTAAQTARYLCEQASGVRVSALPPNEFRNNCYVRNKNALHVFISQTGTSAALLDTIAYAGKLGMKTAVVSENPDTPASKAGGAYICMECGHEEYGIRTIGYSTTVMTLMTMGIVLGEKRGILQNADLTAYGKQVADAVHSIPEIIEKTLHFMDVSRRRIMRSRFIAFTGVGPLWGVAQEGAVKMWEAPQFPSAAYEMDEGMHGPNFGYNDNDAVIILNDGAPGMERAQSLARYMKNEHRNGYIFGVGALDEDDVSFEPKGGAFRCLEFAAAVQTFMYRLAVDGGRDFSILGIHAKMNSYFDAHKRQEKNT